MYQELHRWDECIAVAEAKVLFPSSVQNVASSISKGFLRKPSDLEWGWGFLIQ